MAALVMAPVCDNFWTLKATSEAFETDQPPKWPSGWTQFVNRAPLTQE
jgi:hypothetical protein